MGSGNKGPASALSWASAEWCPCLGEHPLPITSPLRQANSKTNRNRGVSISNLSTLYSVTKSELPPYPQWAESCCFHGLITSQTYPSSSPMHLPLTESIAQAASSGLTAGTPASFTMSPTQHVLLPCSPAVLQGSAQTPRLHEPLLGVYASSSALHLCQHLV